MFDTVLNLPDLIESYKVLFIPLIVLQLFFFLGYLVQKMKKG